MDQERFRLFINKNERFHHIIGLLIMEKEKSKLRRDELRRKLVEMEGQDEEDEVIHDEHELEMEPARKSRGDNGKVVLNGFELQYKIGQGAYGRVYLAKSLEDGKMYAVKRVDRAAMARRNRIPGRHNPSMSQSSQSTGTQSTSIGVNTTAMSGMSNVQQLDDFDDVMREVMVMKKLQHSNIVRLTACFEERAKPASGKKATQYLYLVQEYMQNGPIQAEELENDPLPVDVCRLVFRGMLAGLQYLHWQGVVHRDIKPSNVLIDKNNVAKIADFGTAALVPPEDDKLSDVQGTPAFQPPEVFDMERGSGKTYSGFAADMWSMGATLYSLAVGHPPYMAKDEMALVEKVKTEEFKVEGLLEMDPSLRNLVQGLLEKDPNKRTKL